MSDNKDNQEYQGENHIPERIIKGFTITEPDFNDED